MMVMWSKCGAYNVNGVAGISLISDQAHVLSSEMEKTLSTTPLPSAVLVEQQHNFQLYTFPHGMLCDVVNT